MGKKSNRKTSGFSVGFFEIWCVWTEGPYYYYYYF